MLLWPAQSPDLNLIEHLWEHIQRQPEKLPSITSKSLWENIVKVWRSIPPEVVKKLVSSMPQRIKAVRKAKGGQTKY